MKANSGVPNFNVSLEFEAIKSSHILLDFEPLPSPTLDAEERSLPPGDVVAYLTTGWQGLQPLDTYSTDFRFVT